MVSNFSLQQFHQFPQFSEFPHPAAAPSAIIVMGGVELCTFKLLDTISRDRLGEECGHGHPGAAVLAGQQAAGGQQDIGFQAAGGGNGQEAGAVQTEVNEVPPAPCYPSWPCSGYNWRLTRGEESWPIIHTKRFNSTTLPISQRWTSEADGVQLILASHMCVHRRF